MSEQQKKGRHYAGGRKRKTMLSVRISEQISRELAKFVIDNNCVKREVVEKALLFYMRPVINA